MPRAVIERPALAVDVVLLRLEQPFIAGSAGAASGAVTDLAVLLQRRRAQPFAGMFGLPGVAVRVDETLEQAARRALVDKTELRGGALEAALHLEQLATFDALSRDPRGRTVSVGYLGLVARASSPSPRSSDDAPSRWQPLSRLVRGSLPFDHEHILSTAIARLRGKLRYTDIAAHLLPQPFRIDDLRAVYEAILGRQLNRSNFRTKLVRVGLIERVGQDSVGGGPRGGRPPNLYRFSPQGRGIDGRDFL